MSADRTRIEIDYTLQGQEYALFDSKTGEQLTEFKSPNGTKVEFNNLDPKRHYDIGVIENDTPEKPIFHINWTVPMRDDTETILENSDNLPVSYPCDYYIIDHGEKPADNRTFILGDKNNNSVAEVKELTPPNDKLKFKQAWTFKMVDDTKK